MKLLPLYILLLFASCKKEVDVTTSKPYGNPNIETNPSPVFTESETNTADNPIAAKGDFNGDGKTESTYVTLYKKGEGNPVEGGTPDYYAITFSDKSIPPITECCGVLLVNEGDLDNNGTDELSILLSPANGCIYSMATYTLRDGDWEQLLGPFMVPTDCGEILISDLEKRVFTENGIVYFYKTDLDDENFKQVKTEALLK